MKDKSKFALELFITLLVASLFSSVVSLVFSMIASSLGVNNDDIFAHINMWAGVIWGLYVGYKLKSLIEQHRDTK